MRFWRNTERRDAGCRSQSPRCPTARSATSGTSDADNGFRPAGLFRLSTNTVVTASTVLQDFGSTYAHGHRDPQPHALQAQRAARWCSAPAPIQWSWGLDATHDRGGTPSDVRMQQATVNLFADMNVQPATLQPGLVRGHGVDRHDGAGVDDHLAGAGVDRARSAHTVTITGTADATRAAASSGGVEVSVDGGATWHPRQRARELDLQLDADGERAR